MCKALEYLAPTVELEIPFTAQRDVAGENGILLSTYQCKCESQLQQVPQYERRSQYSS